MTRVVIAMSGGVDSSVAAALLKQQGYEVIGVMMRLWSEPGREDFNRCCTPDAMAIARRIAALLEIPFYTLDAQDIFYNMVVRYFIDGYAQGTTPNPCLVCNHHIRWKFLLNHSLALGAKYLATGHYARLENNDYGNIKLLRGVDRDKDQSYVLYTLNQEQILKAKFPLGGYTKTEVREMAEKFDLPVANRSESQDLCFLAGCDYRNFLIRHAPQLDFPGTILTRQGQTLGKHRGLAFYTIGQRKGLGVTAPHPLYVLEKDTQRNELIVGQKKELGKQDLKANAVHWICGEPPESPIRSQVKIRYKAKDVRGLVTPLERSKATVRFDKSIRDITPGQAVVFYNGEVCLGGGIIQE